MKKRKKGMVEKQIYQLKKNRKERIRIQQEYQQSELDLMDEGLGKRTCKDSPELY